MKQDVSDREYTEVMYFRIDPETKSMLEKLGHIEDRSRSSELRLLIRREYHRLIEPKPELPNL